MRMTNSLESPSQFLPENPNSDPHPIPSSKWRSPDLSPLHWWPGVLHLFILSQPPLSSPLPDTSPIGSGRLRI